jgi:Protein of unknown function (DUF4246)
MLGKWTRRKAVSSLGLTFSNTASSHSGSQTPHVLDTARFFLFLIDPNIRIISTANVPCQQKDWWTTVIQRKGVLAQLPFELQEQVFDEVEGFPISLKEAKKQT